MNILLMILGAVGGLVSFCTSFNTFFLGDSGQALSIYDAGTIKSLSLATIPLSILGIVGSAKVIIDPKYAGRLMVVSSLGVLISSSPGHLIGSSLLLLGGILSFLRSDI